MTSSLRFLLCTLAAALTPAYPQSLRFEVASIKPSQPDLTARETRITFRGDRFEAKAATVGDILDMLGGWRLFRVVGGPDWMGADRYDISAKADRPLDPADREAALLALLAERFHLESHKENREVPGIVLRFPRASKGVKPAANDEQYSRRLEHGDVFFTAVTMSGVTNYLSQMFRAPVVDETQLTERYTFALAISKIETPSAAWSDRVREAIEAVGFKLENRRVPLEVTVVDRCERPTGN